MEKNELPCWVALAIIAGLLLLAVFVWQFPKGSSEWAAWVQAFGTIAAVAAAIYVSNRQKKLDDENRKHVFEETRQRRISEKKSELHSAAHIALQLITDLQKVCNAFINEQKLGDVTNYRRARFLKNSLSAVNRIPIHQMPYSVIARTTIELIHLSNVSIELIEGMGPEGGGFAGIHLALPNAPIDRIRFVLEETDRLHKELDYAVVNFDGESARVSVWDFA